MLSAFLVVTGITTSHAKQTAVSPVYPSEIQTQLIIDISEVSLDVNITNQTIEKTITMNFVPFEEVTVIEAVIEQNFSKIIGTEFTVSVNNLSKTLSYGEGALEDTMHLIFVLDEYDQIGLSPSIVFSWMVQTEFDEDRFWPITVEPEHTVKVQYLKIISSPRPDISNLQNSPISAIILPNVAYSVQENSFFGFIPTEVQVYVVLPRGMNDTHGLNLSVSSNVKLDYKQATATYLLAHGDLPQNTTSGSIQLNVRQEIPESKAVTPLTIRYIAHEIPDEGLILNFSGVWGESVGSTSILQSTEYDLLFFLLATLIPVALVSRLLVNKSRY